MNQDVKDVIYGLPVMTVFLGGGYAIYAYDALEAVLKYTFITILGGLSTLLLVLLTGIIGQWMREDVMPWARRKYRSLR